MYQSKFYYLIIVLIMFSSCNETVKFNYEDAKRSEIDYFFENNKSLNLVHDMDRSIIRGIFMPADINRYSAYVDSACLVNKWSKIIDEADKKMYIQKESFQYSIIKIVLLDSKEVAIEMSSF